MRNLAILLLSAALSSPAWAQTKDHAGHSSPAAKSEAKAHKGTAVVKSIDADKGTVMLAHDPIPSLKWPSMTMKFIAKDKKLLSGLKPGQKVQFEFIQQDRDYILTKVK